MISPAKGILLIANPFLKDPNFTRSVILMCEHQTEGSFGFVLNKRLPKNLNEILPDMEDVHFPVYLGGPVQQDSLHFLHQYPDLIGGGEEIANGIFWGGNFESLIAHIRNKDIDSDKIRFFVGYSGWVSGQLDTEMKEESWLTVKPNRKLIFETAPENTWKESINLLGGNYKMMINFPIDPTLN